MSWIYLIIAGLFEACFAFCLGKTKDAAGIAAIWWWSVFVVALIVSMVLMIKALQTIPVGTAYAVWTGIGAAGSVIMGILFFKDPASFWRLFFLATLIGSIIGLKAAGH